MCPIIASRGEGKVFTPAPEGLHQAVCVDVVDRGILPSTFGPKHKIDIIWQVVPYDDDGNELRDVENENRRFQVMQRYTLSLHEKALLHQHLKSWRGQPFTDAELDAFDVEKLIGANCQIQVVHNVGSNGKKYGNVQAIVKKGPKQTALRPAEYERVKDRTKQNTNDNDAFVDPDDDIPF